MRFIVFTTAYDPYIGGAELALQNIIERLPEHEFDVITKRGRKDLPKFESRGNVRIHRVGFGHYLDKHFYILLLLAPLKAWQLMKKNKYDIGWAMMANQAGIAAMFVNRILKLPYLLTLQEGDSEKWFKTRTRLFSIFYKAVYRRASAIQTISDFLKKRAYEYDAPAPKVVVPNGIDTEKFAPVSPYEKTQIRKELGLPEDKTIVVTTSRLVEKNAVDVLIKSVAKLSDVYLLIAGDGPLRGQMENLIKGLNLQDRVRLAGEVSYSELHKYVQAGDVFARPSRSEGLGTSFLEAMAVGLPVIGTEVGGIPDILDNEKNGLFCKVDDPEDLAKQIKRLMDDRPLYEKLAGNAYAFAQKFSWDDIAKKMKPAFDLAANPKKRILITTGLFPPDIGGPATYVEKIASSLHKRNYGVGVITYSDTKYQIPDTKYNYLVYIIERAKDGRFNYLRKFWHYVRYFWVVFKFAPYYDLIYVQDAVSAGLPTMIAAKLRFKKYVLKIVGDHAWEQGRARFGVTELLDQFKPEKHGREVRLLRKIEKSVADHAKLIITPSKYLKERVLTWDVETPIKVIYNSVDIAELRETGTRNNAEKIRKKLGLSGTVLLTVARLVQWKGLDTLINIFPDIREKRPDAKLVIIGDGPDYDRLKNLIEEKGLANQIHLIGRVDHEIALKYMAAADVFILNSGYEGLPHIVVEALMLGTPVLASEIGGNPEVVVKNETGFLFGYDNEEEIVHKVFEILSNRTLREKFVENGRKYAEEKFNFENMVNETINTLENV